MAKTAMCNVGQGERVLSAFAGGMLLGMGLRRTTPAGVALSVFGAGMLLRAARGYCALYEALGITTVSHVGMVAPGVLENAPRLEVSKAGTLRMHNEPSEEEDNAVTEASMESFPASDPPSWVA